MCCAFSKVAKFCYTFYNGQWQFLNIEVWQKRPLFLYFYISVYLAGFGFYYACQIWQKFITQFCQFWHNSATHIGINSGSFHMLMFAIFGKNIHYFIYFSISAYIVSFGFFSLCLPTLAKVHNFPKMETKTYNEI